MLVATRICPLAANASFTLMNAQSGVLEVRLNCGSHAYPAVGDAPRSDDLCVAEACVMRAERALGSLRVGPGFLPVRR